MIIEIRTKLESDVIYTAHLDLENLHYSPRMEDVNATAWKVAVEEGVLPEDSEVTDYIYTIVEAE